MGYLKNSAKNLAAELGIQTSGFIRWCAEFAEHGNASFDFIFRMRTSAINASMMTVGLSSVQGQGEEYLNDDCKRVKELEMEIGKPNQEGENEANGQWLQPTR